jgi:hypothetical protein
MILAASVLCPALSFACDHAARYQCKDAIRQLVVYRSQAMEFAFGEVFAGLPPQVSIQFVSSDDEGYAKYSGRVAYDVEQRTLFVPVVFLSARTPIPLKWAASYWPYYGNARYQQAFPLIAAIDNALWGAVLQETARQKEIDWPHEGCRSVDVTRRLPCEMLISGVASLLTDRHPDIFNSNQMERIWPESFSDFERRSWRNDRDYGDVRRFGGIMLLRPLFSEFGAGSALAYVAQTPFVVEGDNMRASALRYQERARETLQNVRSPAKQEVKVAPESLVLPVSREPRFIALGRRDGV